MAEASISQLIVLVVSLSIAVTVGGVVLQSAGKISGSIKEKGSVVSKQLETDIKIINDPDHMAWENNVNKENLIVYVKNIGSRNLPASLKIIDLFIDGNYVGSENIAHPDNLTVLNGGQEWGRSKVLEIETSYDNNDIYSLTGGRDHKLKVVVYNNEDTLKFRLED